MYKFDFSYNEYQRFLERCPFIDEEKIILDMRRHGKSVLEIATTLNIDSRTVNRRISKICKKIYKEI